MRAPPDERLGAAGAVERRAGPAALVFTAADYDISGDVAGRRSASAGFLAAYLRHAGERRLTCLLHEPEDAPALHDFVARHDGAPRPVDAIALGDLPRLAEIGTLYTPGPDLARYAWLRRGFDQRSFSLVGVTHTLSESRAMEAVGRLLTAPVQPWDALVCTTRAAKSAVERVLEEYADYFRGLSGARLDRRARLPVIPLGVDCDAFVAGEGERAAFRARHNIPQDAVVLLYMGRLDHAEKANPVPLYMAAQHAAERIGRPLRLLEVGWFRSDFFAEAFAQAAAVLAPSVPRIVLDSRQAANRRAWFAADIFVSLADSVQETFGLTPIEAMAAGLPVIVSDWDGYRDTVRDGIDGFRVPTLTPPAGSGEALALDYALGAFNHTMFSAAASQSSAVDVKACAEAIGRLIADPDLRRRMGTAGRRRAIDTFDWRVVIAAYQELWRELGERRRSEPEAAALVRGRPARPLEMDPFDLFRDWSSDRLAPETVVTLPEGASAALAGAMRELRAAAPMPAMLLDAAKTGRLVEILQHGPTSAGELIDGLEPALRPAGWRTLAWLAKTALLSWR
ncbi:MAG TPA: glycosyltransferase family 4 protein [Stellaceae bacterium]|nr:glycosyltransferase family 4 protein [Stellaceae bacterium]